LNILLVSQASIGAWFILRLIKEGHSVEWWLTKRGSWENALSGLVPPPYLRRPPESVLRQADLILFDQNGQGRLAEELSKYAPVLGDSLFASKMEDDRLFGIEVMEAAGIEVPFYETFKSPDEAQVFLKQRPARYVYKPSTPKGEEQSTASTYVSSSAEDMSASLDRLFEGSFQAPFLLQEVVDGEEISVEGWFDGSNFHFLGLTLEEKKFMNDGMGPNTGAAATLEGLFNNVPKLHTHGLGRLTSFLRENNYRGMIDLNTIVNESHAYGLEFTTRWGYDCCPTRFSLMEEDMGQFLFTLATAPEGGISIDIKTRALWAASCRYSIPPYPMEIEGYHAAEVCVSGIALEDAWRDCYLYDAKLDGAGLVTAGVFGHICSPIGVGHTAKGAWDAVARRTEKLKIPNGQARTDCCETTLKRLEKIRAMGWI
jgi:phosphoribosylamine-glycine ligase